LKLSALQKGAQILSWTNLEDSLRLLAEAGAMEIIAL
jgi:hypothetical protein